MPSRGREQRTQYRNIEPVEDLRNSLFSVTLRSPKLEKACYEQAKALVAEAMRILEDITGIAVRSSGHIRVGVAFNLAQTPSVSTLFFLAIDESASRSLSRDWQPEVGFSSVKSFG